MDQPLIAMTAQSMLQRALELIRLGKPKLAEYYLDGALAREPRNLTALFETGRMALAKNDLEAATRCANKIIAGAVPRGEAFGHLLLGNAARQANDHRRAVKAFERAVKLDPNMAEAYCNMGGSLIDINDIAAAFTVLNRAVELAPNDGAVHANFGICLYRMGHVGRAADHLRHAVALNPEISIAWTILGSLELDFGRPDQAIVAYREGLKRVSQPGTASQVMYHMSLGFIQKSERVPAVALLKQALEADGNNDLAAGALLYQAQWLCDWDLVDAWAGDVQTRIRERNGMVAEPFAALSCPGLTASDHQRVSAAYGRRFYFNTPPLVARGHRWNDRRKRLRVGFLCGDFRDHPVAFLVGGVLAGLDRMRIEAIALSYGDATPSEGRRLCLSACESHVDLNFDLQHSIERAAQRIAALELDVLVDLQCYTANTRSEILRFRPAPVQGHYLAFASTAAAECFDFTLLDAECCPPEIEATFTETVLKFSGSYFPLFVPDDGQLHPTRAEQGLPENAIVFSAMCHSYKINRDVFTAWCDILRRVDGSVLWIRTVPPDAEAVMRATLQQHGVDPSRMIVAPSLQHHAHIARLRLADIGLDTWPFGAHTTLANMVSNAVPVVTLEGDILAARTDASLLRALGLDELVASTVADYVEKAVNLALNVEQRGAIQAKMRAELTPQLIEQRQLAMGREMTDLLYTARESVAQDQAVPAVA